ncbi:MAG: cystathionine gamma-synthase [Terricaulis sp.]
MTTHDDTLISTAGVDADVGYGAVMPPIYLSSNYSFAGFGEKRAHDYCRSGNPNRDMLVDVLAALEQGADGVITSTGMSAVDLVLNLIEPGALVVAPHDCYGGTWRLFTARAKQKRIEIAWVNQHDADAVEEALARRPALLWIETPSNPLMRVVDVVALAKQAKAFGAKVVVDNTFLSPALQKPITLGADFVVHSTTKYINGHSDVVGGAVIAADAADAQELKWWANCTGVAGAPFNSWLTLRGLRTLNLRIERQQKTAGVIAERLAQHPAVRVVHYPGLKEHPSHAIAAKQQLGFGAMLSFEIAAKAEHVREFLAALDVFTLAESLGGTESLIAHPASMTHASMAPEARAAAGIDDRLLRVSVGLEHAEDLWSALERALGVLPAPTKEKARAPKRLEAAK